MAVSYEPRDLSDKINEEFKCSGVWLAFRVAFVRDFAKSRPAYWVDVYEILSKSPTHPAQWVTVRQWAFQKDGELIQGSTDFVRNKQFGTAQIAFEAALEAVINKKWIPSSCHSTNRLDTYQLRILHSIFTKVAKDTGYTDLKPMTGEMVPKDVKKQQAKKFQQLQQARKAKSEW